MVVVIDKMINCHWLTWLIVIDFVGSFSIPIFTHENDKLAATQAEVGTKIFWSPEFFDRDYGQKAASAWEKPQECLGYEAYWSMIWTRSWVNSLPFTSSKDRKRLRRPGLAAFALGLFIPGSFFSRSIIRGLGFGTLWLVNSGTNGFWLWSYNVCMTVRDLIGKGQFSTGTLFGPKVRVSSIWPSLGEGAQQQSGCLMQIVIWCSCSYIPVVQGLVLMWCVFTSMKLDHQLDFRWVLGSWVCPLERMLTTWAPIHHPCSVLFWFWNIYIYIYNFEIYIYNIYIIYIIYTFINRCTPIRSWASLYACGMWLS